MDKGSGKLQSYQVLSAFVSCSQQGRLPGCRYEFDDEDAQCIDGRKGLSTVCVSVCLSVCLQCMCILLVTYLVHTLGRLCGTCSSGYGVTLDLQSCREECAAGIVLFILLCEFICCFKHLTSSIRRSR